jgi:signal transduction histidine kinase
MAYLEGQKDLLSGADRQHYMGQYSQRLVERLETKILELEEANVRLQKIDKLKSDFITIAAHELRTPITLVYGYPRLLQVELKSAPPAADEAELGVKDLADKIHLSVHRLSEVVNDILNISLIETNQMKLDTSLVPIGPIVQLALDELNPKKNDREIFIELGDLGQLPPIHGDAKRLRQVFWNILSNAIKFTPDQGRITIEGWIAPPPGVTDQTFSPSPRQARRGGLVVMIKDTGIGIDPSEQKEIFDRFYMVNNAAYHSSSKTAFGGGGMGLGLPIAKGIIEAHGGRIWVESRGRDLTNLPGSTFYVLLPLDFDPAP